MPFSFVNVRDQKAALKRIAQLIDKGATDPVVVKAARKITSDCPARDDLCELEAIYRAVKEGDPRVPALAKGLRYVADPRRVDLYRGAKFMLKDCEDGACGGDCDDATILVGALCASIGFKVGARAYARPSDKSFTHVYCVAAVPKNGGWPDGYGGHGMDTTVDQHVGWEPPEGRVLTYWLEE